jgi:membrane associated rhomboid family serine protease
MLLPFRTSVYPRRTPYVTYALIAINIFVFLMELAPSARPGQPGFRPWVREFWLVATVSPWWTYVSYAFLHYDLWHIVFNMFFLYLFGRVVNDKLGSVGFLAFYVAGAAASGLGQAVMHPNPEVPVLGASGAVAAVTGAYLVLFPQSLLTIVYWFFFIGTIEVPALYFILLKLILLDNVLARGRGSIAYDAHLAGYGFGIGVTLLLLMTGIVRADNFDLWAMIRRWNRRRRYRDSIADGYDPFSYAGVRKRVAAKEVRRSPSDVRRETRADELRSGISRRIEERNLPAAADLYLELMELDPDQVLPRQQLLDVANHLASDRRPAEAARAYHQFLSTYGNAEYSDQVQLMLGILYARYLNDRAQAIEHLQKAEQRLSDGGHLKMCREELARLRS